MSLQAFAIIYCLALMVLMIVAMAIERYITRKKWPQGHGKHYFWQPKRYTDTE